LARGSRGLWTCFAVGSDSERAAVAQVERRDVEILYTTGQQALVRGTLSPGEMVVAGGPHRIVAGQLVKCVEIPPKLAPSVELCAKSKGQGTTENQEDKAPGLPESAEGRTT
jgi:hypothetical protein